MYNYNPDMTITDLPARPPFTHPTTAIQSFIDYILDTPTLENRPQFIILSGIMLNNVSLIEYASSVDPTVVNTPIPNYVETLVKQILTPEGEHPSSETEPAVQSPA